MAETINQWPTFINKYKEIWPVTTSSCTLQTYQRRHILTLVISFQVKDHCYQDSQVCVITQLKEAIGLGRKTAYISGSDVQLASTLTKWHQEACPTSDKYHLSTVNKRSIIYAAVLTDVGRKFKIFKDSSMTGKEKPHWQGPTYFTSTWHRK